MKKLYIQPEIICCVLQSKMLMAVSGLLDNDNPASVNDVTGDLNNEVKVISNPNLWDNEW